MQSLLVAQAKRRAHCICRIFPHDAWAGHLLRHPHLPRIASIVLLQLGLLAIAKEILPEHADVSISLAYSRKSLAKECPKGLLLISLWLLRCLLPLILLWLLIRPRHHVVHGHLPHLRHVRSAEACL